MEIRSGVTSPASFGSRSGVLSPTPSGDDFRQVARFFGDLAHKKAVVGHFQQLGTAVISYFSGLHRGWYVKVHRPDLVPEGVTSIKKLAEIFEFHFQTDISFVFGYNKWLPGRLEMAPTGRSSASGCLLNWLSRASVAKLPHDELVEAMSAFEFQVPTQRQQFEFPLDQSNPSVWIPGQDLHRQTEWMLQARFHFGYPDICGYERGGNGFTSGDSTPWFLSARTRLDGKGCVGVRFPPRRSIFDNDPPGSNNDRWPVDGLWHPDNNSSFLGFRVHLWVIGRQVSFDDPLFSGPPDCPHNESNPHVEL